MGGNLAVTLDAALMQARDTPKVFQRAIQQHRAIQKERRQDAARNRLNRLAQQDQHQAEREPSDAELTTFLGR